jgi:hypothetical protein
MCTIGSRFALWDCEQGGGSGLSRDLDLRDARDIPHPAESRDSG